MSVESWSLVAQMSAALVAALAAVAAWRAANASRDAIRADRVERRLGILSEMHAVLVLLLADLDAGDLGAFREHRRAIRRLTVLYGRTLRGVSNLIVVGETDVEELKPDDVKEMRDAVDEVLGSVTLEISVVGHGKVLGVVPAPPWWRRRERRQWLSTRHVSYPYPWWRPLKRERWLAKQRILPGPTMSVVADEDAEWYQPH